MPAPLQTSEVSAVLCIPDWFTKSAKYHHCSDHALLQSLVVLATPPRPRPCCAPALYRGLDILHLDPRDNTKLAVTHWRNVKVSRCACA